MPADDVDTVEIHCTIPTFRPWADIDERAANDAADAGAKARGGVGAKLVSMEEVNGLQHRTYAILRSEEDLGDGEKAQEAAIDAAAGRAVGGVLSGRCSVDLNEAGLMSPRTCQVCGLGPCVRRAPAEMAAFRETDAELARKLRDAGKAFNDARHNAVNAGLEVECSFHDHHGLDVTSISRRSRL